MEESRNNRAVERRIKDALKNDRARIQVGRISHFGLLEMSRQRIRTGVIEGSTVACAHCQGAGVVRSTASIALHVLRGLEDALIKSSTHDVVVRTRTAVALYILNQKRANLRDLEGRFGVAIAIDADDTLTGTNYHAVDRGEISTGVKSTDVTPPPAQEDFAATVDELASSGYSTHEESEPLTDETEVTEPDRRNVEGSGPTAEGDIRRRRRRRRRRGGERSFGERIAPDAPQPTDDGLAAVAELGGDMPPPIPESDPLGMAEVRSEGGRSGRRSRRPRGQRNHFPALDDAPTNKVNVSDSPETFGPDTGLESDAEQTAQTYGLIAGHSYTKHELTTEGSDSPQSSYLELDPQPLGQIETSSPTQESQVPPTPPLTETPTTTLAESTADEGLATQEPVRPRRSGWWQRARASIVGD